MATSWDMCRLDVPDSHAREIALERLPATEPSAWVSPAVLQSPFGVMRRFADEMDRLFEDFRARGGCRHVAPPLHGKAAAVPCTLTWHDGC
jgi:hypothetical protein